MAESKNNTMTDFQVTFFIGDQVVSRLLSDVIKNRDNSLFAKTLGLPEGFVPPFFQEEGKSTPVYMVKQKLNDAYKAFIQDAPCNEHIICSGDYIFFKNAQNKTAVKTLFIATSDIYVGYKKYKIEKDTNIFIGRTPINDISFDFSDFVSREKHAAIRIDSTGSVYIEDLKRSIGIYVNGKMTHSQQLKLFDEVFIMGLSIIYMGDFIAVRNLKIESSLSIMNSFTVKIPLTDEKKQSYFVSTPRILKSLDTDEIEVDGPPAPQTPDKTPAVLVLGPSITMSMVMLASFGVSISSAIKGGNLPTIIASGTMAVGMLLGSLLWPSLLRSYQKRRLIAEEKYRKEKYSSYIADIEKTLIAKTDRATRLLNETLSPAPEILCTFLDSEVKRLRLWERSVEDDDFLAVRMGIGKRPFDVHIKIPRQGFQLHDDEMRDLPNDLLKKYGTLSDVPMTLDIRTNHTIGIIGNQKNMNIMLNELILNVISLHSYNEVKLVLVAAPKQAQKFEHLKNIPHIWSDDKKVRYLATTPDETHFVFNTIDEVLKGRERLDEKTDIHIPHYILIVAEPSLVEKEALVRYMNDSENEVGLTTIFAYGDITRLPKSCKTIIQSDESRTGYYIKNKNENKFIPFVLDTIDTYKLNAFADALSHLNIKRDVRSLGIVDRISFLQMYKVGNVEELGIETHWDNNNSAKSLAAPIGVMAGGEVFSLDIHEAYHGCHGLVAGTTGSGKSEFLQAFVLSLAINYSPKEVAFVLVDFKGGDMARPFMAKPLSPALPHLAATISNLSGNVLYRALVSLEAEIKSRQRLFNEFAMALGVDKLDINSYHKYYKGGRLDTPLPHLVIIIDEFAQLKTQQPDFLAQLINVAQVGRSLGIHLILATQKPSGIVDPQIMSNSRFKVCLKVADKQDSIDMINKPDSALIKNPGRLYLQVGYDEIYECVQSGYSGADYVQARTYMPDEEITVQMTDNAANPIHSAKLDLAVNKTDKTQLEAVVAELVALGKKKNSFAKPLWLEMLPKKVLFTNLALGDKSLCIATLGLVDYVRTQEQKSLHIDFTKTGHIALYGASGTGKTTFLQTLVYSMIYGYKYTPDELNIYAMDFGGRNLGYLDILPHTGGVVFADDEGKIFDMVSVLHGIIEERKRLFAANNCGTFSDYHSISKKALPAILVLIDNYSSFRDKYMDASDDLTEVISAGRTFGIYFVITGSTRNSIYYKVTEHIATYFTLKMNDPGNYLDILNARPPIIPEDISGRGITIINKDIVEFQTAIAFDSETEADRLSAISDKYSVIANNWNGELPIKVSDYVGDTNTDNSDFYFTEYSSSQARNIAPESIFEDSDNLVLGISKSGALHYGISLTDDFKICVCAADNESLLQYYQDVLNNISEYSNRHIVFIDDDNGTFEELTEHFPNCRYVKGSTAFDTYIEDLKPELNSRLEDNEQCSERLFLIIAKFNEFFDMITDEQAAFMRKVMQYIDLPQYGIYFVCGFDVNNDKNNDRLFMNLIVNAENYVICPNSYAKAISKIETLPVIHDLKTQNCYLSLSEKNVEIRW